jgi:hypothetical protein
MSEPKITDKAQIGTSNYSLRLQADDVTSTEIAGLKTMLANWLGTLSNPEKVKFNLVDAGQWQGKPKA